MKKNYLLIPLIALIMVTAAAAITIPPGVYYDDESALNWTFNETVIIDDLSLGVGWVQLDDDNISFTPTTGRINLTVSSYTDENNNELYLDGEGQSTNYEIDIAGEQGVLYYNDTLEIGSFTALDQTIKYYFTRQYDLNLTFLDEQTKNSIKENISISIFNDEFSASYWTTTGSLDIILPQTGVYESSINTEIYHDQQYTFTISGTENTATIYLLNKTQAENVSISLIDQSTDLLEGYTIKAFKRDLSTGDFFIIDSATTGIEGSVQFNLFLYTEYYRFLVYNEDDELIETTQTSTITSNTLTLQVNTAGETIANFDNYNSVSGRVTLFSNTFSYTYDNSEGTNINACLQVYERTLLSRVKLIESCQTQSGGTISHTQSFSQGKNYEAIGTVVIDGVHFEIDRAWYGDEDTGVTGGLFLQLMVAFVFVIITLIVRWQFTPVAVAGSFLIGRIINLTTLDMEVIAGFMVAAIIVTWWLDRR